MAGDATLRRMTGMYGSRFARIVPEAPMPPVRSAPTTRASSSSAESRFFEMFPDAARIGSV
jgi:hypothetical protein